VSDFFLKIKNLLEQDDFLITDHAFRELAEEEIAFEEIRRAIQTAVVVEEYPNYHKGPAILVLTLSEQGRAIHSLWGIPKGELRPATLITAYLPDAAKWEPDNKTRKMK
jgi:Domain of unknown function (DUF4258)